MIDRVHRRAALLGGAVAALALASRAAADEDPAAANKAIAERYIEEIWNAGDEAAIDALIAEDYAPSTGEQPAGREAERARIRAARQQFAALLPDVRYTVDALVADAERAMIRGRIVGTSTAGAAIEALYFNELVIVDGRIATVWAAQDQAALLRAL